MNMWTVTRRYLAPLDVDRTDKHAHSLKIQGEVEVFAKFMGEGM